jgi:hypothetical protein
MVATEPGSLQQAILECHLQLNSGRLSIVRYTIEEPSGGITYYVSSYIPLSAGQFFLLHGATNDPKRHDEIIRAVMSTQVTKAQA